VVIRSAALVSLILLAGCDVERIVARSAYSCRSGGPCDAAGPRDAPPANTDLGSRDATPADEGVDPVDVGFVDAVVPDDTGVEDVFAPGDGGDADDGAVPDDGGADAGFEDADPADIGLADAGNTDADPGDTGVAEDTGVVDDTGVADTGVVEDTGTPDTGPGMDAAVADAGAGDTGPADAGLRACMNDTECSPPVEICHLGFCNVRCGLAGGVDCAAIGETCNFTTGHCTGTLSMGDDCAAHEDCQSDFCFPFAVQGMSQRKCSRACSRTGECPSTFQCINVVGFGACLSETLFGTAQFRTPAGGACSRTVNTCQSGWCSTAQLACIEDCMKPADCVPFGGQCYTLIRSSTPTFSHDNLCINIGTATVSIGDPCRTNGSCRSGVCDRDTSRCAQHCCSSSDCGATENCAVYALAPTTPLKVCKPRPPTAGPGQAGDTCNGDGDCETGICYPDAAGTARCSSFCCSNMDCNLVLSGGGSCRQTVGPTVANTLVGRCVAN